MKPSSRVLLRVSDTQLWCKTFLYHLPLVRLLFELPCKLAEGHAVLLRVLVVQPHQQGPAWWLETHCHQLVDEGGAHLDGETSWNKVLLPTEAKDYDLCCVYLSSCSKGEIVKLYLFPFVFIRRVSWGVLKKIENDIKRTKQRITLSLKQNNVCPTNHLQKVL